MFSKADIFAKDWLDIVFKDRNKSYGAYELRKFAPKATSIALGIVAVSVLGISGIAYAFNEKPVQISSIVLDEPFEVMIDDSEVIEIEKPIEKEEEIMTTEKPLQVAQDIPSNDVIKFTEINATDAKNVNEDIASTSELLDKTKILGNMNLKGMKNGTPVPDGIFGKTKKEGSNRGVLEGDINGSEEIDAAMISVEIMPEPIGGMKKFIQWVADNYQYPQNAIDAHANGLIEIKFVVEKDGSLTAFEVSRDLGFNTGSEAIKLLKKAPKWNPGIQNGRKVRVAFNLPIRLNIQQ